MKARVFGFLAVVLAYSCTEYSSKDASPTFGEAFFSDEEKIEAYLNPTQPEGLISLDQDWIFLGKDSIPGIDREFPLLTGAEAIHLPHRLPYANHSFWYSKKTKLQPGILWIDADDGAQLWVNRSRLPRSSVGDFFEVQDSGQVELSIRAVNNAMAGGLRGVRWISFGEYETWDNRNSLLRDSIFLSRKTDLIADSSLHKKIEALSVEDRMKALDEYPLLMTEPVLLFDSKGGKFVRWLSEKPGKAVIRFSDGKEKEVESSEEVFTFFPEQEGELEFWILQEKSRFGPFKLKNPASNSIRKIAIWGDSQGGWATFHRIAIQIESRQADLSIGAGDLVNNGSDQLGYPRFLQKLSLMRTAQFLAPGNHDYDGFYEDLDPVEMKKHLFLDSETTYGVQIFDSLGVIRLDPNEHFPVGIPAGSGQRKWLEKVLESEVWRNLTWKLVVLHQPPFSQGWPDYHGEESIRLLLEPFFHRRLIDVVVAGHTHDYERLTRDFSGHPVTFLVVGGAGGGLEPEGKSADYPQMDTLIKQHHFGILEMQNGGLKWEVFGVEGGILDRFFIPKRE